jgi:hypothetical protein
MIPARRRRIGISILEAQLKRLYRKQSVPKQSIHYLTANRAFSRTQIVPAHIAEARERQLTTFSDKKIDECAQPDPI